MSSQSEKRGKKRKSGKKDKWEDVKMSSSMEEQFKAILNPSKNVEDSFNVDLAEKLETYLQTYVKGEIPTNFNSAALLIQGSSNLYSKKVEYLYNLASNLHEVLTKNNRKDDPKKKDPKERAHRQSKTIDPFCSTEIKAGKNLSCLRKKNIAKVSATAAKKSSKKTAEKKHAFVPVDLLPLECEEKGDVFYDTRGEAIGNKNDYTLNKCRITKSGWLLMPTVSPENIESEDPSTSLSGGDSPADEGYPASSGCPSSPPTAPSSQAVSLSQPGSSQQTDEGLGSMGSTPLEAGQSQPCSSQGTPMEDDDDGAPDADIENIPLDDFPTDEEFVAANKPVRRSMRTALKEMHLKREEQKRLSGPKEDLFAVKRPIEKNNTVCYPPGMRSKKPRTPAIFPASVYCARTFFSVDSQLQKNDLFSLQVTAFANNTKFLNQIKSYKEAIKAAKSKRKANGEVVTTEDDDSLDVGAPQEALEDEHSFAANPGLTDDDFDFDNEPLGAFIGEENPFGEGTSAGVTSEDPEDDDMEAGPSFEFDEDDYDRIAEEQMALFRDDLQTVEQTTEMTKRVRQWEKLLKPFLEDISKREKFDINLYGSQILNAFDESNRRQTMMFKKFCEGKEKYEIHRYFLALLPLANVGNVSIANESSEDGIGDDIAITLLSRRMHHMELEDFGHNEGQHN